MSVSSRLLQNKHEAQDVVQEAFLVVWQKIGTFKGESSLYTWLHKIVINLSLGKMRAEKSRLPLTSSNGSDEKNFVDSSAGKTPDEIERMVLSKSIHAALAKLAEPMRIVVILKDIEQLENSEIAEQLGIPEATIRQRLHRGRAQMAESLRPEFCTPQEMYCGGRLDLLMGYLDKELAEDVTQAVSAHVNGCADCKGLETEFVKSIAMTKALQDIELLPTIESQWSESLLSRLAGTVSN